MLTKQQIKHYDTKGYLLLEEQVPKPLLQKILKELEHFNQIAATMHTSDELVDLEETHSKYSPRIRRIKLPHAHMKSVDTLMRDACILEPVKDLLGSNLRLHSSKLNMKSAGYGAAVEWHQDWAFYPHTNDDILAVGVMLDDMTEANGPLLMVPGSHRGKICNHHSDGMFVGAIDPNSINTDNAVPVLAPAGSISLHHVRLVHGSDVNLSLKPRRLLLFEITSADAFPLMGTMSRFPSLEEYDNRMLCGLPTLYPRLTNVPVRIPLPTPDEYGSIYQLQSQSKDRAFDVVK